ncbi:MAG TPA: ribonuclease D [Gammaproteobacteria bacterium]|nr:ribonuclease D [Gammaproteobacteria bacterium]
MDDAEYIDRPEALATFCQAIAGSPWIALDTEFMRERTYRARLCLIQVADPEHIACIDPIALPDLDPLLEILYDPGTTKVLHAAQQDLEVFYDLRGQVPAPVFDTQVAAALVGQGSQTGYARLARSLLGVQLDKSRTRSDWSRRPLEAEDLAYAADDVRYLREIYTRLREELERRGRLSWLEEDFRALADPARYAKPPEDAWRRVKGGSRLRARSFAALQRLAAWRETQARERDLPRQWVLKDSLLLDVVQRLPSSLQALERVRGMPAGVVRRHGEALLAITEQARAEPDPGPPPARPDQRLDEEQQPLVDLLMSLVRVRGGQQDISPATLASRREIEMLLLGERNLDVLSGWRRHAVGEDLLAALDGRLHFVVRDGRLDIVPATD